MLTRSRYPSAPGRGTLRRVRTSRFLPIACLLALCALAAAPATAAAPRYGLVQHGWVSVSRTSHSLSRLPVHAKGLVAHFQWQRVPTAGLPLQIGWYAPDGSLRAIWKDRTLKSDRAGTILWTSISRKVLTAAPGRWHVELRVDGRLRGYLRFAVPKP